MMNHQSINRCPWPLDDPLMIEYHDKEWGVAVHDDYKLFEFITLDAFQARLSWKTILHKREGFRNAFDGFDFEKVALYDNKKINELLLLKEIIRNRQKIAATIRNARSFIAIREEFGTFDNYIWRFVDRKTIRNHWETLIQVPATSHVSDLISKDLKKRGFAFAGSTICYAFMQAAGLVNDHLVSCFRYNQL